MFILFLLFCSVSFALFVDMCHEIVESYVIHSKTKDRILEGDTLKIKEKIFTAPFCCQRQIKYK